MAQIAILQTAFLGDTLLSLPLAKNLVARGERLALICRQGLGPLFLATRLFETVIEIEKGNSLSYRKAQEHLDIWWMNSSERILLSPHESPRSKMFAMGLRLKGNATATVGYRDRGLALGPSFAAYSHRVARPMELPEAIRQLALLGAELFPDASVWRDRISAYAKSQSRAGGRDVAGGLLPVPDWASMRIEALAGGRRANISTNVAHDKLAVLAPGSVWKTKQWTEDGFIEVGRSLVKSGREVLVIGTSGERETCEAIVEGIAEGARTTAGQSSLLETAHDIARAEVAIVNDSGAMHIAAMVDTPVVAVFGPTVLDFGYRPWLSRACVVEPSEPLSCRPCGLHGSQLCPIGTHICMRGTSGERVWREVRDILEN